MFISHRFPAVFLIVVHFSCIVHIYSSLLQYLNTIVIVFLVSNLHHIEQCYDIYVTSDSKVGGSNPGGGEIFCARPDRPRGQPSLVYYGYRIFPGGKAALAITITALPFCACYKHVKG
jgi:hypothetical protein